MARKKSAAKKAREAVASTVEHEKKKVMFDDDDGEVAAEITVDAEFEKRFNYNKDREEKQRLEEKYKKELEEEESSSSEEEDEYGDLITEELDQEINTVLKTIKENPQKLKDPELKFFGELPKEGELYHTSKQVSVTLKDYHRQRLLSSKTGDLEADVEDEERPYAVQQEEERQKLLEDIANAEKQLNDDEDDDEDDFLVKKDKEEEAIEDVVLPEAKEDNEDEFLQAFLDKKAWLPSKKDQKPTRKGLDSDSESEFEDINEKFEHAYNYRFEDPAMTEIVSYARNQNTIRRSDESSRKRARDRKKDAKEAEEKKYQSEVSKLKKMKTREVMGKLEQLKQEVGEEIGELFSEKDLEADFDASTWDKLMEAKFNDEFYAKKDKKPEFDDDDLELGEEEVEEPVEDEEPKLSKAQQKKLEKQKIQKEKKAIRETAEKFVEKNLDIALEEANIVKPSSVARFKYREVSPDSFGLSARDILVASDTQLNSYYGLKKLGEFRDEDQKKKDRRKLTKKRRLQEWRKETFKDENGPSDEVLTALFEPRKKQKKSKKN